MALKITSILMNFTASLAPFVAVRNRQTIPVLRSTFLVTQSGDTLLTQNNERLLVTPVYLVSQSALTLSTQSGESIIL